MNRRNQQPPSQKATKRRQRALLLATLREQRRKMAGASYYQRTDAPELFDLAIAADRVRPGRRTFIFRGVRFRLNFGWRRYVLDPVTGETICGGKWLA